MILTEITILCGGLLSLAMFVFHTRFPKLFLWKLDLRRVSEANRKILHTIHLALLLLFLLFGLVSLAYFKELARAEGVAFGFCLALALFWLWRTIWQMAYFRPTEKKQTFIHIILTVVFFLLFVSYALPPVIRFI